MSSSPLALAVRDCIDETARVEPKSCALDCVGLLLLLITLNQIYDFLERILASDIPFAVWNSLSYTGLRWLKPMASMSPSAGSGSKATSTEKKTIVLKYALGLWT